MKAIVLGICCAYGAQSLAGIAVEQLSLGLSPFWTWAFGCLIGFVWFDSIH